MGVSYGNKSVKIFTKTKHVKVSNTYNAKLYGVIEGPINQMLKEAGFDVTAKVHTNSPVSMAQPFATGAPMPMETAGMPEPVAKAVTRDYSDLMKAINKKKEK